VGYLKRRKYGLRNHTTLEVEQLRRRRYILRYHMTLEEGVRKKKNQREFRNRKRWGYYNTKRRDIQDITFGNRSTN
jgi:hypothetical protein